MQESQWFTDSTGTILGVILFNPDTKYWGYVMYARGDDSNFKRLGVGADLTSLQMAVRDLTASMDRHVDRNDA